MTNHQSTDEQKKPIPPTSSLWENWLTVTGAGIAILAVLFFVVAQIVELLYPVGNPYRGIWAFMVLPALLVVGLDVHLHPPDVLPLPIDEVPGDLVLDIPLNGATQRSRRSILAGSIFSDI